MDVSITSHTYDRGGAYDIFSSIGALLTIRLGNYGKAVESIEIYAHLRSKRPKRGLLRDQFDDYDAYLKSFPVVFFHRKLKRLDIGFLSEHLTAEDNPPGELVVENCEVAMREIAAALSLIKKRIKPGDDFDVDGFLAESGETLKRNVESSEGWDAIWQIEEKQRLAKMAVKSPWELLEVDWSRFHPKARTILDDPFYWEEVNELAPNGNDTGAELLEDFRRWNRRNKKKSPTMYFADLLRRWEIEPIDWRIVDDEAVKKLNQIDPVRLNLYNEAAIALAFAVVKLRGTCPSDVSQMAKNALERTRILLSRVSSAEIKSEWDAAIARMRTKLDSMQY